MNQITYQDGYKYQLAKDYYVQTTIFPPKDIIHQFFELYNNGWLLVKSGYAWDGATCFPDFKFIIRPSLGHDAKYQMLRLGLLSPEWREAADNDLRIECITDGASSLLAKLIYEGIRKFGQGASLPRNDKINLLAP